jgi:RHS repeat-associated protein
MDERLVKAARSTRVYGSYGERLGAPGDTRTAYAGQIAEAGSGWYLLGARVYSPVLRRFLAPDPVSPFDDGGINRYAYCNGDPINRIDPSGETWRRWAVGNLPARPFQAGRQGRIASLEAPPGSRTPGMTAVRAATTNDASVVSADVPSGPPAPRGLDHMILGRTLAGATESVGDVPRGPKRKLGRDAPETPARKVNILHEEDFPLHRQTTGKDGRPKLRKHWAEKIHPGNPNSRIWAADTAINERNFKKLFRIMKWRGVTDFTLYTGSHGRPDGKNWGRHTGVKVKLHEPVFHEIDAQKTTDVAEAMGMRVTLEDMTWMTKQDMHDSLATSGEHVIGFCYGIADEVVMEALNLTEVNVYHPWVPAR